MLGALLDKLRQGARGLVGNRGFQRFLKVEKGAVSLDQAAVKDEARFDGKYALGTTLQGAAGKICQAAGASIRPSMRPWENTVPTDDRALTIN